MGRQPKSAESRSSDDWDWSEVRRRSLQLAYRYSHDRNEAEDIAQEAVLRAWCNRARLKRSDRLWGWLAQIVRNEAARHYARHRRELASGRGGVEGAEDEQVLMTAERADLQAALRSLGAGDRLLLRLRYNQDLTHPAIASLLDMPEGTVKVRLHRARARLQRIL
jgi:RNA polymerase sigma-70 factor, ECF subfamily